ncbi:peroxide stress protein YaaA [soil metagenome]
MSARSPLILLPPSEGKAVGGDGDPWAPGTMQIDLDAPRRKMMAAVARAMRQNQAARAKLLGVKGVALAAATETDRQLRTSPTMPAIERYTGVLYDALDVSSLPEDERTRLDQSVLVVSGLWGLVAPSDPIPDYKLKMGASLPGIGRTTSWWRPFLSEQLAIESAGRTVWSLLPNEHAAAWAAPADTAQFAVKFLERRPDGMLVAVSHWNQLLKGALVRFLLANPGATPETLADWHHPLGYRLDLSLTVTEGDVTQLSLVQDPA